MTKYVRRAGAKLAGVTEYWIMKIGSRLSAIGYSRQRRSSGSAPIRVSADAVIYGMTYGISSTWTIGSPRFGA
jgi:hypothetical protein